MDRYETIIETPVGSFSVMVTPLSMPSPKAAKPRRKRQQWPKTTRMGLLNAQHFRCALCQGPMGYYDSHIDHIVPLAAGGSDEIANLQLTHGSCNLRKGVSDPRQDRMPWA